MPARFAGSALVAVLFIACGREASAPKGERIISVAPNLTELLFAAGAGEQVVAVSAYSDYPEAAKSLPQIGDAFRLDYEAIVALEPTVAVVWDGGTPAGVAERLEELGMRVVAVPAYRLDDIATGLVALGALAGTEDVAAAAAADFRGHIDRLRATYRDRPTVRVFVAIDDAPLFTVGGPHLISELLELCGGINVFAKATVLALPVDLESVLVSAPEVILSADDGDPVPFWSRFDGIQAVKSGNVFRAPADRLSRPSPRIAEGAAEVCRLLDEARRKREPGA